MIGRNAPNHSEKRNPSSAAVVPPLGRTPRRSDHCLSRSNNRENFQDHRVSAVLRGRQQLMKLQQQAQQLRRATQPVSGSKYTCRVATSVWICCSISAAVGAVRGSLCRRRSSLRAQCRSQTCRRSPHPAPRLGLHRPCGGRPRCGRRP